MCKRDLKDTLARQNKSFKISGVSTDGGRPKRLYS